jgi:hypothetical protein
VLPVLIVGFLRKDHLEKLIQVATSQGVPSIYVSLDGPRNEEDDLRQNEIIKMIDNLRRELPIRIDARRLTKNVGAGAAVISAVDWFFQQETRGIVLEDDLLPNPSFFNGATKFLERGDVDSKILMFSGTNVFEIDRTEIVLLRYPVVWGWAATQENWATIRALIFSPIKDLSFSKLRLNYFYWRVGKRRALRGITHVWDVPLAGAMYSQGYYCALSPTNLVTNSGHDSFASNTKENVWPLNQATKPSHANWDEMIITSESKEKLEQFMREKIFKISLKYILSSFFWNFFDFVRWRSQNGANLEEVVSTIEWKHV